MEFYKLSDYDYRLPPELIAQEPLPERDSSRMMVLHRNSGIIENTFFKNFSSYLRRGDILVLNNTRVIPARLIGRIAGKDTPAELLLLRKETNAVWVCMVKPGRKLKPGASVTFPLGVKANVTGYAEEGLRLVAFNSPEPFEEMLPRLGQVPLPPYIKKAVDNPDQYQTIYALENGSAAAPTAGFHFTEQTFEQLKETGVDWAYITLHIGPGTFQPVKADDIREHVMHREYFHIDSKTADRLNDAREKGGRILAVGTTACRVLESVTDDRGIIHASDDWTGLYIYPGFKFKAVDAMLTNFHLPRSSLMMLVSALAGHKLIMEAYHKAVEERYRFFSFGDCMLII
ncbi:MAG: tRNA preQ1(34) S-adenosylmethionine ribosyltransferase-isomerase QueA [Dethiobacteria bacterium]|nr:tRNA preQ1(34) S-adenosylmethionine ribosyltransferase-isomerase QueA [Bacillota bacterium]